MQYLKNKKFGPGSENKKVERNAYCMLSLAHICHYKKLSYFQYGNAANNVHKNSLLASSMDSSVLSSGPCPGTSAAAPSASAAAESGWCGCGCGAVEVEVSLPGADAGPSAVRSRASSRSLVSYIT